MGRYKSIGPVEIVPAPWSVCLERCGSLKCGTFRRFLRLAFYERLDTKEIDAPLVGNVNKQISSSGSRHARLKSFTFKPKGFNNALASKLKNVCEHVVKVARKSSPHLYDLFVGNHMLMHITAAPLARQTKNLVPSSVFSVQLV
eukprot:c38819_g1_i1 orf=490-921(+)